MNNALQYSGLKSRSIFLAGILFIGLNYICSAQYNHVDLDTISADNALKKCEILKNAGFTDEATLYALKAEKLFQKEDSIGNWLKAALMHSQILYSTDEANELYKFLLSYLKRMWREPQNTDEYKILVSYHHFLAFHAIKSGYYLDAKRHYEECIKLSVSADEPKEAIVLKFYKDLATIYTRFGDYEKAESLLEDVLAGAITKKLTPKIAVIYHEKGVNYKQSKKYPEALFAYQQAINFGKDVLSKEYKLFKTLVALGNLYEEMGDTDQAATYALAATENILPSEPEAYYIYSLLANIELRRSNYAISEQYFEKALNLAEQIYESEPRREIAEILRDQAKLYAKQGRFELALLYQQRAISNLIPGVGADDPRLHPKPEDLYADKYLADFLLEKGKYFLQIYKRTGNRSEIDNAVMSFQLGMQMKNILASSYDYEGSKLYLARENHLKTELAVEATIELYKLTGELNYLQDAFVYTEQNKATILLEAIQHAQAMKSSSLPDSIRHQEAFMRQDWVDKRKTYHEGIAQNSRNILDSLRQAMNTSQGRYQAFIRLIENTYPQYKSSKRNISPPSLDSIQQHLLQADQAIVSYFMGDSNIYAFVITPQDIRTSKIPLTPYLKTDIEGFPDLIQDFSRDRLYAETAYRLYRQLLGSLNVQEQKLIIIPDGELALIPFDALLTFAPDQDQWNNYKTHPYLILDKNISYAFSATMLANRVFMQMPERERKNFAGFAPVFEESDASFNYLRHSEDEVNYVENLWEGVKRLGKKATIKQFKETAPYSRIIHICSHGHAASEDPMLSYIAFQKGEHDDGKLFLPDLYAMDLYADLVVLSACETGVGEVKEGEGVMSLARGFTHSGCKSLITTLWSVTHDPTYQIMRSFYKHLHSGLDKGEALRQAKLDYLTSERTDKYGARPRFWAAHVAIGDMSSIPAPQKSYVWAVVTGLIIIFALAIINLIIQRRRKAQLSSVK